MKTFTVNGKRYNAKSFDFNLICDLEDLGISLQEAEKKPMSIVRAYFSFCAGRDKEYAGKEMEQHIINGGSFDDVTKAMSEEMGKSDFFRSLKEKAEEEAAEDQGETTTEETVTEGVNKKK